jgi:phosphoserine aminotransferase
VGGFRLSLYNALKMESVEAMLQLLKQFAAKVG